MIFILNTRHGGTSETMNSLFISWNSFIPLRFSQSRPHCLFPISLGAVTERKYHYPPVFHRRSEKLFRILKLHIYRKRMASLAAVILYRPQDYCIPDAVIRFSSYLLKETFSPLHLYRGRSKGFNNPKIDNFLKVCAIYPKSSFSFCL